MPNSSTDTLEKRLRERFEVTETKFTWADIKAAARIGAEIEREECAATIEAFGVPDLDCVIGADAIRARGGK